MTENALNIAVVEDDPADAKVLQKYLAYPSSRKKAPCLPHGAFGSSDRTRSCPMGNPDGFAHTVRSPAR